MWEVQKLNSVLHCITYTSSPDRCDTILTNLCCVLDATTISMKFTATFYEEHMSEDGNKHRKLNIKILPSICNTFFMIHLRRIWGSAKR